VWQGFFREIGPGGGERGDEDTHTTSDCPLYSVKDCGIDVVEWCRRWNTGNGCKCGVDGLEKSLFDGTTFVHFPNGYGSIHANMQAVVQHR